MANYAANLCITSEFVDTGSVMGVPHTGTVIQQGQKEQWIFYSLDRAFWSAG